MQEQLTLGSACLAIAASVVDRSRELMLDGQSKSQLNERSVIKLKETGGHGIEKFCVHGAMNLAFQEMFPERKQQCGRVNVCGGFASTESGYGEAEAVATAILVQVAAERFGYNQDAWKSGAMGVAPLNDDPARSESDVIGILEEASRRLWAMALEEVPGRMVSVKSDRVSWADEEPTEGARQAVYA